MLHINDDLCGAAKPTALD